MRYQLTVSEDHDASVIGSPLMDAETLIRELERYRVEHRTKRISIHTEDGLVLVDEWRPDEVPEEPRGF